VIGWAGEVSESVGMKSERRCECNLLGTAPPLLKLPTAYM
jgi:hypothetical protein